MGAGVGVALAAAVGFLVLGPGSGEEPVDHVVRPTPPPTRKEPPPPLPRLERAPPAPAPPPATVPAPPPPPPPEPPSRVELIAGFESEKELKIFENLAKLSDSRRVTEHATQGRYSLRVRSAEGKRARLAAAAWLGLQKDWSRAKRLCLDVFVEEGAPVKMGLGIRDKTGQSEWNKRRNISVTLVEGANPVEYRIEGLLANDRKRKMVLSDVYQFQVSFTADEPFVVYVDNVRLED